MAHWAEQYVGRPYVEGKFECVDLVRLVALEQFGKRLEIPTADWRGLTRQNIEEMNRDYAVQTISPREGDAVLLKIHGRVHDVGSHIGVFSMVCGAPWVLHCIRKVGAVFCSETSLQRMSLSVVGYYRWK